MKSYGKELIIDMHDCDISKFNRKDIKYYFIVICEALKMERCKLCWWDDKWIPWFWKETEPHIKGTTAIQFIRTSDIRIHALELQKAIRINIFSCKEFEPRIVEYYTEQMFRGKIVSRHFIDRY